MTVRDETESTAAVCHFRSRITEMAYYFKLRALTVRITSSNAMSWDLTRYSII